MSAAELWFPGERYRYRAIRLGQVPGLIRRSASLRFESDLSSFYAADGIVSIGDGETNRPAVLVRLFLLPYIANIGK